MAVVKWPGVTLTLGGAEYVVPPLSLNALEQLQDALNQVTGDLTQPGQVKTIKAALHASLVRNYPDMTIEAVGDMVDLGNAIECYLAVMDVSGMRRKQQEAAAEGKPTDVSTSGQ